MSLQIEDDETAALLDELADKLKTNRQGALKVAVKAELDRLADHAEFDQKLKDFYARYPPPPPTGLKADKAFFDELSGEFD